MKSNNETKCFTLSNEFAAVEIRKVTSRNGMRLEIYSPALGYKIQLDPLELESLTWQNKDIFTKFLENPFGPNPL